MLYNGAVQTPSQDVVHDVRREIGPVQLSISENVVI